jgi:aerobic-type carbon monoxide dehydrogenase small subunit (CoxS/CutS family)
VATRDLIVNGKPRRVEAPAEETLLSALRDRLG